MLVLIDFQILLYILDVVLIMLYWLRAIYVEIKKLHSEETQILFFYYGKVIHQMTKFAFANLQGEKG